MSNIWLILLVLAGLFALIAGVVLAIGNKPWSDDDVEPTYTPAGPDAEGMEVMGPGEIGSGTPEEGRSGQDTSRTRST